MIFSHVSLLLLLFKILKQTEGNLQSSPALLQVHKLCYTKNSNDNKNVFIFILLTHMPKEKRAQKN
jgi:hypothetical protein